MNRCDLEEVIVDLEYLLEAHASDPERREEYQQQLCAFRALLQAVNQRDLPKSGGSRTRDWDADVALLYADEELFLAAQALIARDIPEAHKHLRRLLQHEHLLPVHIGVCLHSLDTTYTRLEDSRDADEVATHALATTTIALLDAVRRSWRNPARATLPDPFFRSHPIRKRAV